MRALLRLAAMATSPTSTNPSQIKSHRLAILANQLRLYKAPPSPLDAPSSDEDAPVVDARGKVFSPMAVAESSAPPTLARPDRFHSKTAAVLICLFEDSRGDLRVILTKRSSNLSTHSGEVSLPGGKTEEGDKDEKETALREANEEIGLEPSLVSVVTTLEPFLSKHLLRVTPVIAILDDRDAFKPVLNPSEVEEMFDAPLEMFLKDENKMSEERNWMGVKYLVHFFDYNTEGKRFMIWGLTAGILIRAASVVYQRSPSFMEQSPEYKTPYP
ncbi:Nudix hydrolase [Rhynchospora pubera]|uniref:Nudix hydrolase n=1 Tax=Rhynchospora pubera TaxID=906938 RepID=A0AAV8FV21_9POAL|nr:Nudix hydrolase [Rhynchospora pubera]